MKLPKTAHTDRAWRIHEFTADFRLEDVWPSMIRTIGRDWQQ
ncbi:hypothetical protein ACIP5Y_37015 [Nocardia sp. NPDC088792]